MKKFTAVIMSAFVVLTMLFIAGCESETENQVGVIGVEILQTDPADSVSFGGTVDVTVKLTGFTFEYKQINYYFGTSETPAAVYSKDQLDVLAASQEKNAEFTYTVSTDGLEAGWTDLTVEAVSNDLRQKSVTVAMKIIKPSDVDTNLDLNITSPVNNAEFRIGDNIQITVGIEGNLTMFDNLSAYINTSTNKIYYTETGSPTISFSFPTVDLPVGPLSIKVVLKTKNNLEKSRIATISLIEYIPTFTVQGEAGYELKGLIQTFDKGYLSVSSGAATGTRVVKYDEEGVQLWATNIANSVGIAESVCEDSEYDKGYVLAGWRQNGAHKDTWVRKINQTNGGLIWNKTYGINFTDDAANVIKKTVDDGYIIGGWSLNPWGTDELLIPYNWNSTDSTYEDTIRTTWETGYDVRLIKIYSNGNEAWGDNSSFVSHRMWHDIALHKKSGRMWVTKMGDQVITDLVLKDDGNYYVTGWNNFRLYTGNTKKDMFYAEVDYFGGFKNSMTWSRIGAYDAGNLATQEDPYGDILNISIVNANFLGDPIEDEIGYSIVKSQGGYAGDVVMAGETYQIDSKSKFHDAWVVEFKVNDDEDGALWENAFGDVAKNDKAYSIDRTRDNGYIVTGYTSEATGTNRNTWLFKLDGMLRTVWSVNHGVNGTDDFGWKVLQTTDGGFIIGGNTGTGTGIRSKLIKVNKTGQLSK
jgi:hypothetical protein